jgi:hypothetical protein
MAVAAGATTVGLAGIVDRATTAARVGTAAIADLGVRDVAIAVLGASVRAVATTTAPRPSSLLHS